MHLLFYMTRGQPFGVGRHGHTAFEKCSARERTLYVFQVVNVPYAVVRPYCNRILEDRSDQRRVCTDVNREIIGVKVSKYQT